MPLTRSRRRRNVRFSVALSTRPAESWPYVRRAQNRRSVDRSGSLMALALWSFARRVVAESTIQLRLERAVPGAVALLFSLATPAGTGHRRPKHWGGQDEHGVHPGTALAHSRRRRSESRLALVLGELLQLRWTRRIWLLVFGCGWVFICNVFRATALVFVAANSGLDALGRWHDAIGTAALVCGMAGMLGLAWFWKGESRAAERSGPPRIMPAQWSALAWLALIFAGTELWYRSHERQLIERPAWQVNWPQSNDTVSVLPIPDSTRVILRYDDAKTAAWEEPRGVRWWTFFAHWKPQRAALQLVRSHSPEICLPAIGRMFRRARPDVNLRAGPVSLDFRSYEFEQNGQPLFVFVCIQEDKRPESGPADGDEWNLGGRLRAVWQGKRSLGQRLLEIAVSGVDDFAAASEALAKTAKELLRPEKTTD